MSTTTDLTNNSSATAASASANNTALRASSLLKNVTRYEDLKTKSASKSSQEMGKQDFLTLFTAQLKNQNPLDPVKNEAFVAQLAQFSQLEALTNMQSSMDNLVKSMTSQQLNNSASLIGYKVPVADGLSPLQTGGSIDASIDLPNGASGVTLTVQDSMGRTVQQLIGGAQNPGTAKLSWDGLDAMGNRAPSGYYRLTATAVVDGKTTTVPVSTMATVQSISVASDGSLNLEIEGGKTVPYKDVQRLGL